MLRYAFSFFVYLLHLHVEGEPAVVGGFEVVGHVLRIEFMEADVDAIVVGFVASEELPFSDCRLDGVVGGFEGFCIGALLGGLLHHVAEV